MIPRALPHILLVLTVVFVQFFCSTEGAAEEGMWSKEATLLSYKGSTRRMQIPSPGHNKIIVINDAKLDLVIQGKTVLEVYVDTLAELGWSPNSKAFFITASDGGWVGTWGVIIFVIENGRADRYFYITKEVIREFKKHYSCREPQDANVGAIKWIEESKYLLLVAEVPPHSNCLEMGKTRGYVVEIPTGRIVEEFDENVLKRDWDSYLGARFRHK